MVIDKEKIINFIENKDFNKAEKLIKSSLNKKNISSAKNIEFYFSSLMAIWKQHDLLKHLNLDKVPPRPINTSFDIGRRFFYTLHLINQRGGHRIVSKYLDEIVVSRTLEYRFLGGMFFDLLNFEKSAESYKKAYELIVPGKYISIYHDTIINNLLYALFYSGAEDEFNHFKSKVCNLYGNKFTLAISSIESLLAVKNKDIPLLEKNLKSKKISENHSEVLLACASYLKNDKKGFEEYLQNYERKKKNLVYKSIENPRRYFSGLFYIKCLLNASTDDFKNIINFRNFPFPINAKKMGEYLVDDEYQFSSLGIKEADNYINLYTEEYLIHGERGLGLSSELKALACVVRAGSLGISFEYLAGEIYDDIGYSEMFLIRARIKQVIHRIKNRYNIKIVLKKYIAYIDEGIITNFRIDYDKNLTMEGNLSAANISKYYSITEMTAHKYMEKLKNNWFNNIALRRI